MVVEFVVVLFCCELGVVPVVVVIDPFGEPGVNVEDGVQFALTLPGAPAVAVELVMLPVLVLPEPVVPVVGTVVQFVDEDEFELGVTVEVPPAWFWLLLGVVLMPLLGAVPVEVLGLVCGVATPPLGVAVAGEVVGVLVAGVVLVVCPPSEVELLELLMLPVAVDCCVCPTPAGIETVPPGALVPVVPVVPVPAVPVVCATAKAVQQSASVTVIKSLRMKQVSLVVSGICRFR